MLKDEISHTYDTPAPYGDSPLHDALPEMKYKQLALAMVKAMIADKKRLGIAPDYAINIELHKALNDALLALVAEGCLILRSASVNRIPAYELPEVPCQPIINIKP